MKLSEDEKESEIGRQAERLRAGDREALAEMFESCYDRLTRMVDLRLDSRVRGRLDAADVLQDAFLDAEKRLDDYVREAKIPPFLWLRLIVGERILALHRHHLGARMRDAGREVSLYHETVPEASSVELAAFLEGRMSTPSEA